MMPLNFPYQTLKHRSFRLDLVGSVISGGITNAGQQQVVNATGGGLWALQLEFPTLRTADQIRTWRVVQFASQGGVVPFNISICDLRQAPRPSDWLPPVGVPHSDDSPFSDDSLYASETIVGTLSADAAVRATTVSMILEGDGVILGGEFFSLSYGDDLNELHVVTQATQTTPNNFDVTFLPPLRAAHLSGETVIWDHPTGTFRMAQQDSMSAALEYGRFSNGSAAFVEYFPG